MKKRYVFLGVFIIIMIVLIYFSGMFIVKKYNLSDKFGISGNVVDSGTYENKEEMMDEFSRIYVEGLENGEKTYLVLRNGDEITVSSYEEISQGELNLIMFDGTSKSNVKEKLYSLTKITPKDNQIEIVINGKKYQFDLRENEKVYMIIKEKIE